LAGLCKMSFAEYSLEYSNLVDFDSSKNSNYSKVETTGSIAKTD